MTIIIRQSIKIDFLVFNLYPIAGYSDNALDEFFMMLAIYCFPKRFVHGKKKKTIASQSRVAMSLLFKQYQRTSIFLVAFLCLISMSALGFHHHANEASHTDCPLCVV